MRHFITPEKDTTIYQQLLDKNSGLDEILEVGKLPGNSISPVYSGSAARILMGFEVLPYQMTSISASYFLNLKLANATNLKRNQSLIISVISRSWDEGSGYFYDNEYLYPATSSYLDGATWNKATTESDWSSLGADILSGISSSITLSTYPLQDIRADITQILQPIVNSGSTFFGLMVQFPDTDEADNYNKGLVKAFSLQSHTIHQPTMEVAWDDQIFVTGSLREMPSVDVKISAQNLRDSYAKGEVSRINITVRDQYPSRTFDSILRYSNKYYLPTSSYYSITEVNTGTMVIPFDEYSKIHCDANGSYIVLDTSPLYSGRHYSLKYKISTGSYERVIDTGLQFQVR